MKDGLVHSSPAEPNPPLMRTNFPRSTILSGSSIAAERICRSSAIDEVAMSWMMWLVCQKLSMYVTAFNRDQFSLAARFCRSEFQNSTRSSDIVIKIVFEWLSHVFSTVHRSNIHIRRYHPWWLWINGPHHTDNWIHQSCTHSSICH